MAGIPARKVVLQDNWPGVVNLNQGTPTDGFDATTWHDVTNEAYPVGTKIQVYTDYSATKGWSTLAYLHFYCLSGSNAVEEISASYVVFQQCCNSTCVSSDGTSNPFACTNCGGIDTGFKCGTTNGVVAIPCGTISDHDVTTDGNNIGGYGWFWVGGVCPVADCTIFDTANYACISTDGNVVAGGMVIPVVDTSAIVLGLGDASPALRCGYAMQTDA